MNQKPRFQTLDQKRQACSDRTERTDRFERQGGRGYEAPQRQGRELHKPARTATTSREEAIWPREAKKANVQAGNVQVWVKGVSSAEKEKKTGPLSPRAPEKIRKNRAEEMKIYGENSCFTLFQQRPEAIVRLWATVEGAKKAGELLSYLAEQKKAYHVVDSAELEKVTGTEHHGGICLLVKKSVPFALEGYLQLPRQRDCLVLLDGVNNPQNIGAIMRTCAFYGVKGVIVEQADLLHSSAAARVAEGGLEFVHPLETKHKQIALTQLRNAGYQIVYFSRDKKAPSLAKSTLQSKVVFVLSDVMAAELDQPQDTVVQLSFANPLASGLNVAVCAGVALSHWYQQQML